jgi:outer membrane receptor protein involved in Fe transport
VIAPYLVDRIRVSDEVKLFVGARLDVLDYEDPPNATDRESTRLDPLLGLVYSATSRLALHANWATGSAPPSTQVVGARDLEHSTQVELGGKLTFLGGKGLASLAAYEVKRENIGVPDSTGVTRQEGDQRSRGIEMDLAVEATPGWETRATYAYTDSTLTSFSELIPLQPPDFVVLDRSGNRAPFAPRHIFGLWTTKGLPHGLGVSAGLRHVSEQYIAPDNGAAIDGYTTLDAAVSFDQPRWGLRVHFKNLTGTEYATRGFGAVSAIPARPFEVNARVRIAFGER